MLFQKFFSSTITRCSHRQSPYQLLFGEPHLFEDLLGLKICISPDAFFQNNTAGAEVLYQTVGELSGVNSNTILLDICCGTGKWWLRAESTCCLASKHYPESRWGGGGSGAGITPVIQNPKVPSSYFLRCDWSLSGSVYLPGPWD